MGVKFTNNATAELASSITDVQTTIVLASGQGAKFPALGVGDYFYATLVNPSNELEIVKVTARSIDTLTILRAQEGTSSRAYNAGERLELRVTAGALNGMVDDTDSALTLKADLDSPVFTGTPAGPTAAPGTDSTQLATTAFVADAVETATGALGTMSTQNANAINVTGGTVSGITGSINSVTPGTNASGNRTVSTSTPSGGNDGDIWYKV
jgi:hypothetical protein